MRARQKLTGTPERPRLNVYRSLDHIYAQVIDDTVGNTIVSASTLDKELKDKLDKKQIHQYSNLDHLSTAISPHV